MHHETEKELGVRAYRPTSLHTESADTTMANHLTNSDHHTELRRSPQLDRLKDLAVDTLEEIEQARPLAREFYVDDEVYALESSLLFGSGWFAYGPKAALSKPGDAATLDIDGEPLLLTCDEAGIQHAFFNTCRHRGSCLIDEPSTSGLKRLRCPYHAWTYRLDGSLEHAPHMSEHPGFEVDGVHLTRCAIEEWQGFLWVSLQSNPDPLDVMLRETPSFSRYRTSELVVVEQTRYEVDANWKLLCQNYSECYHCALAHPELNRISHFKSGGTQDSGPSFVGGPMRLNPGFDTMSLSGRSSRASLAPELDDDDLVWYYVIYPNLFVSLHRDYVLSHTLVPRSPTHTEVTCHWLFHPEQVADPKFDPSDAIEFWDLTNRQDWELCERTQRGARSRAFAPLRYQPSETCVHEFDRWYLGRLLEASEDRTTP